MKHVINSWGEEGTLEEVRKMTLAHMDEKDLMEELLSVMSFSDLIEWVKENCYIKFIEDHKGEIEQARQNWLAEYEWEFVEIED